MSKKRGPNASLVTPPPKAEPKKDAAKPADKKSESSEKPKQRFYGLLRRKEKWVLSWRGRLVAWGSLLLVGAVFILKIHPFLAVTQRVDTQYLVIEGWVPNYGLEESIAEFKSRPYAKIFTVGADPLTGEVEEGDSIAFEAYKRLKWLGVDPSIIQACPANIKYRNRTFESARALRKWAEDNHVPLTSFNLVTLGAHARRSRLLFEEAFDGKASVGIISVTHREYDPQHWWKYSEGVREVIGESIAYVYARFLFHPGKNDTN